MRVSCRRKYVVLLTLGRTHEDRFLVFELEGAEDSIFQPRTTRQCSRNGWREATKVNLPLLANSTK